jgi:ATP-dependent helicase HrpB
MAVPLPIDPLLPDVVRTLDEGPCLVLEAPPGAGKTTRVPRALLDAWPDGEIIVLEPRRLAARLAARRVSEELGEEIGGRVGYVVRFEDISSPRTRIRFVTEGVLTRRMLGDPELRGVRAVILDEFHERHLHADVALAFLRGLQRGARPDLRIVVMSATLDAGPIAEFLHAPTLRAEGRRFDVTLDHLKAPDDRPLGSQVASAVRQLVNDGLDGDVLVFLPGAGEIRRARESCEAIAREADLMVVPLHGDLPPEEQDRAIRPASRRKLILSTNVAESSVTIDGVVAVIDSGLARAASFASWSGLPMLRVQKISRASATQRAGRAGRTRPGRCVRLYTKADFDTREAHDVPEIRRLDLAQTCLELAARTDARSIAWLEAPPEPALRAANELLTRLDAIDANGALTVTGKRMLAFPLHPRLARVVVEAEKRGVSRDGSILAALVAERDIRSSARGSFGAARGGRDAATERSDLIAMLDLFREAEESRFSDGALRAIGLEHAAVFAVDRARKQIGRIARDRTKEESHEPEKELLACILAGYPDRVAKRKKAGSRDLAIAGGGIAELAETSVVRDAMFMVAIDAEARSPSPIGGPPGMRAGSSSRPIVRLASAIEPEWLIDLFPGAVEEHDEIRWDEAKERVERVSRMSYAGLALHESRSSAPFGNAKLDEEGARVLADAALAAGARVLSADAKSADAFDAWLARARFAAAHGGPAALTDADVRAALVQACVGMSSFADLRARSLLDVVRDSLGPAACAKIESLAPENVKLTATRGARIHYEDGKPPWIESHLQDFFGRTETPKIAGGRVALVVHLLAPNRRAVQVTTDLAGFWERHYPAIRKELARKYPRHKWPEDPRG